MIPGNRKIQKAKPTPFSRPGIELSDPAYKREWVYIIAEDVALGDTIPDFGVVSAIGHTLAGGFDDLVHIVGPGKEMSVPPHTVIRAFHLVD